MASMISIGTLMDASSVRAAGVIATGRAAGVLLPLLVVVLPQLV
jgi:hypothetical protein